MMLLLEVLGKHLPAVERDLIVSGLHLHDIGTPRLSWVELESFVLAAPPGSATHTSRTESWNRDAQVAAAMLQTSKPPTPNDRSGGGARGEWSGRNERARKLRNVVQPVVDPNVRTTQLLGRVRGVPLDQFKARRAQAHEAYYQKHPDKRPPPAAQDGD
jgi:hypothetical protein